MSDVKLEAAQAMNDEAGLKAALYSDHQAMLAKEKPDVIVTCLWTRLHLPVFRDCAQAGVRAVMSEKPMAPTWGECLEMGQIAQATGCQLTFSHQRRFAAGNQLVRRLIAEGRIGKILRMDLYSPKNLLDCGTHTFDQALSFNGESPAKWALGAVDTSSLIKWFDVSAEGMATGLVVFENGVSAHFRVGTPDQDMGSGVRVIGEAGFIEVDWDGKLGRAVVYDDPTWKPPAEETQDKGSQMIGLVGNALDSLERGVEPELSYKKALRATEIIFALYESVRRRARVELPLDTRDNAFLSMLEEGQITTTA